jgi:hypothetical protein
MSAAQRIKKIIATGLAGLALTAGIGVADAGTASAGTPNKHIITVQNQSLTLYDPAFGFHVGQTYKVDQYYSADTGSQTFYAGAQVSNPDGYKETRARGELRIQAFETDARTGHMRFVIMNDLVHGRDDHFTAVVADLDPGQSGFYRIKNQNGTALADGWLTLTNTLVK